MIDKNKLFFVVIIIHIVGAIGTAVEFTRADFLTLTPFNLMFSALILGYSDGNSRSKLLVFLLLSFLIGFGIEVIGVSTGFPFGNYQYGNTLGLKLFEVPLVIGINWFILSYTFASISVLIFSNRILAAILGGGLMTLFDVLIEPVAIKLDYWEWENESIPLENYLGWFITASIIQYIYHSLQLKKSNRLSFAVLIGQGIYFLSALLIKL